jgi:hypothetical protein
MCRSIINSYNINSSDCRTGCDTLKTNGECEIFQILGSLITNDALCAREIKSWFTIVKQHEQEEYSFHQQIRPKFKEEAGKVSHLL